VGDRFVVLGVAGARAPWFRSLALWATSGAVPVEFVKCVSTAEVRARVVGGRRFSALVADGGLPSVDRDLLLSVRAAGCAVLVVHPPGPSRDWLALGASGVLGAEFSRDQLVSALSAHAATVSEMTEEPIELSAVSRRPEATAWRGTVVAVTGPGGTGVSTAAQALAEAAAVPDHGGIEGEQETRIDIAKSGRVIGDGRAREVAGCRCPGVRVDQVVGSRLRTRPGASWSRCRSLEVSR
jgi:hypothetical protein